jgi:hypothetical protein
MSQGQGSISYTRPPGAAAPFIDFIGARNGTSLDGAGYVVLGQEVTFVPGGPAALLDNRQVPMEDFYVLWENGRIIISDAFTIDNGSQLQVTSSDFSDSSHPLLNLTVKSVTATSAHNILEINVEDGGDLNYGLIAGNVDAVTVFLLEPTGSAQFNDNVSGQNFAAITNSVFSNPLTTTGNSTFGSSALFEMSSGAGGVFADFFVDSQIFDTGGSTEYIGFLWAPSLGRAGTGITRGIYMQPAISSLAGKMIAFENQTGDVYLCSLATSAGGGIGRVGIHAVTSPTAWLHLGEGAAAASSAPLKFASGGTLQTVPEGGAMEYNGTNFFLTPSSAVRSTILASIAATASVVSTVTNKIEVNIGGTVYYLLASTSPV